MYGIIKGTPGLLWRKTAYCVDSSNRDIQESRIWFRVCHLQVISTVVSN